MDIQLFYIDAGEGTPLIFLHGNGGDHTYFSQQIPHFDQRYRVLAPDTRGHGATPRGTAPFTIAQFAEDLAYFLDDKGIEKVILLGFSDGANIAMRFAICNPKRVRALILNGGNLNATGVKRFYQFPIELGYRIAKFFEKYSSEAGAHAEMLALMVNEPNIAPQELSAILCPTLVVAGNRDMIKSGHTREIADAIPGAEMVILEGDHFLAAKHPEIFNACIDYFLSKYSL